MNAWLILASLAIFCSAYIIPALFYRHGVIENYPVWLSPALMWASFLLFVWAWIP